MHWAILNEHVTFCYFLSYPISLLLNAFWGNFDSTFNSWNSIFSVEKMNKLFFYSSFQKVSNLIKLKYYITLFCIELSFAALRICNAQKTLRKLLSKRKKYTKVLSRAKKKIGKVQLDFDFCLLDTYVFVCKVIRQTTSQG